MKILSIEDEPDLGAIIQTSLSHHQYVVDWPQDGQTGWEYLTNDAAKSIYSLASRREEKYQLSIIQSASKSTI